MNKIAKLSTLLLSLSFFLNGACSPRHTRPSSVEGKQEIPEEIQAAKTYSLSAQLESDGSFTAEASGGLQDRFLKKIGQSQCTQEWVGHLQRMRIPSTKLKLGLLLDHMRPSLDSDKKIVNSDLSESYYIPTIVTGVWIEIIKFKDRVGKNNAINPGRVEIRQYSQKKTDPAKRYKRIYRWRETKDCKKEYKIKTEYIFREERAQRNQAPAEVFIDRQLKDLIAGKEGLLYFWSPGMPYSTSNVRLKNGMWGLDPLFKVAKEKSLGIKMLLDPQASVKAARKVLGKLKTSSPKIYEQIGGKIVRGLSMELYMRNTGLHMPTLIYYKNGLIARTYLPGISSEVQIRKYIDQQSKFLSGVKFNKRFQRGK